MGSEMGSEMGKWKEKAKGQEKEKKKGDLQKISFSLEVMAQTTLQDQYALSEKSLSHLYQP